MMVDLSELILLVLHLVVEYILINQSAEALRVWFRDDLDQYDRYNDARRSAVRWSFLTVVWTGWLFADLMTATIIS